MSTMRETVSTPSPGTSRYTGIIISFVTAAAVFGAGQGIVTLVRGSSNVTAGVGPVEPIAPIAPIAAPRAPAVAPGAVPAAPQAAAPPQAGAPAPQAAAPTQAPSTTATTAPSPTTLPPATSTAKTTTGPASTTAPTTEVAKPVAPAATTGTTVPTAAPKAAAPTASAPTPEPARPAPALLPTAKPASSTTASSSTGKTTSPGGAAPAAAAAPVVVAANEKAAKAELREPGAAPRAEAETPAAKDSTNPGDRTKTSAATAAVALPGAASDKPTDKDIAREAWRRNLPDISAEDVRASVLIPIKGSIEGATYHVSTKPKSVIVNLPKADSLITMRFYKIKREGFGNLWIKQDEREGTTLRLMLNEATAPQVEIHDEYVRINVHKPLETSTE